MLNEEPPRDQPRRDDSPEYGSLIVAAVLILAIGFAGYWIVQYAQNGSPPWGVMLWFVILAGFVTVGGILRFILLK